MAKHRNGGLNNIKLKFIANLGRFENLDDYDSSYEFQSKMNPNTSTFSNIEESLDKSIDKTDEEENDDIPF